MNHPVHKNSLDSLIISLYLIFIASIFHEKFTALISQQFFITFLII